MAGIKELKNSLVLENNFAEIHISKKNSLVEKVIDKKTGKDIRGEETSFFELLSPSLENIPVTEMTLNGDVITVKSDEGSFDIKIEAFKDYFTLEVMTSLPEGIARLYMAHIKYDYDYADKKNTGAILIPLTVYVDPVDFPDGKPRETIGRVFRKLGDVEAKAALIIAPIIEHRDILREVTLTIDRNKGIASEMGGVLAHNSRLPYTNYIIAADSSQEWLAENLQYFKYIGVDQIDFHHCITTFRQGDFKFYKYKDAADFKKNVTDVLTENGMSAGLHTYSFYINYEVEKYLADPKYQKQLKNMGEYTLAEDISDDIGSIKISEDFNLIPTDRGSAKNNSPFFLIDEEIIYFDILPTGLKMSRRGCSGTKAACHKKGAKIKHLEGHYMGLVPIFGSELFFEIAKETANVYNEGGFNMIYLDALDGILYHAPREEDWFWSARFVLEVLKYCKTDPIMEAGGYWPSMWGSRGRTGVLDTPCRGYKRWNVLHRNRNLDFVDRHHITSLGWYNFYPTSNAYPGNEHTKYHHTDAIDHMGSLAVMYDFGTVFNGTRKEFYDRYYAMRRNIAIYKKYDDLRKAQYFSEEYREKLKAGKYEYHLKEKRGGKYTFVEKDYKTVKLYDLSDSERNFGEFSNPFGAQVPFVRIEAMYSTLKNNPMMLLRLNENEELMSQKRAADYNIEMDFSENLAKVVRVYGNGLGGKICINLKCATSGELGYGEYIIDVDFKGWREFILLESDNGERGDHDFEKNYHIYKIFRAALNNDRIVGVEVETDGDMSGVRMSSIVAYEHTYEIYKNPTVKIGDTSVMFECELQSGDFIEFDGKEAKSIDRFGNEMPVWFKSEGFKAPRGKFKASLETRALNRGVPRAQLTLGFTGKEVK